MKSWALAARAARLDLVARGVRAGRSAMFSATLTGNRNGSCSTTRHLVAQARERHVAHVVAVDQHPAGGRDRRSAGSGPTSVLLPAPVAPTMATTSPGAALSDHVRAAPAGRRRSRTSTFSSVTSPRTRRQRPARPAARARASSAVEHLHHAVDAGAGGLQRGVDRRRTPRAATAASRDRRGTPAPCRRSAGRRARASPPPTSPRPCRAWSPGPSPGRRRCRPARRADGRGSPPSSAPGSAAARRPRGRTPAPPACRSASGGRAPGCGSRSRGGRGRRRASAGRTPTPRPP